MKKVYGKYIKKYFELYFLQKKTIILLNTISPLLFRIPEVAIDLFFSFTTIDLLKTKIEVYNLFYRNHFIDLDRRQSLTSLGMWQSSIFSY